MDTPPLLYWGIFNPCVCYNGGHIVVPRLSQNQIELTNRIFYNLTEEDESRSCIFSIIYISSHTVL